MKTCPHCNKQFKLNKSLTQHIMICKLKKDRHIEVLPTQKEMWIILQKLYKDNENLKKKVEHLEKIANKDIRKMDMVEWLNKNDQGINIEYWLKHNILVTLEDLEMIFSTDYTRGISNIIQNNLNEKENSPFRAFSHKIKQLYIYEKNKWKKCKKTDIINVFDRISLNILKKSKEYDKGLTDKEKYGPDNIQYLKNCDKIMVVDTKKKERYYKHIESSIISTICKSLNDMTEYKFYI